MDDDQALISTLRYIEPEVIRDYLLSQGIIVRPGFSVYNTLILAINLVPTQILPSPLAEWLTSFRNLRHQDNIPLAERRQILIDRITPTEPPFATYEIFLVMVTGQSFREIIRWRRVSSRYRRWLDDPNFWNDLTAKMTKYPGSLGPTFASEVWETRNFPAELPTTLYRAQWTYRRTNRELPGVVAWYRRSGPLTDLPKFVFYYTSNIVDVRYDQDDQNKILTILTTTHIIRINAVTKLISHHTFAQPLQLAPDRLMDAHLPRLNHYIAENGHDFVSYIDRELPQLIRLRLSGDFLWIGDDFVSRRGLTSENNKMALPPIAKTLSISDKSVVIKTDGHLACVVPYYRIDNGKYRVTDRFDPGERVNLTPEEIADGLTPTIIGPSWLWYDLDTPVVRDALVTDGNIIYVTPDNQLDYYPIPFQKSDFATSYRGFDIDPDEYYQQQNQKFNQLMTDAPAEVSQIGLLEFGFFGALSFVCLDTGGKIVDTTGTYDSATISQLLDVYDIDTIISDDKSNGELLLTLTRKF